MGYRATVGLNYPHPSDVDRVVSAGGLKALFASDPASHAAVLSRMKRVEAGERCDDVPATSVPTLLEQGSIAVVDDDPKQSRKR